MDFFYCLYRALTYEYATYAPLIQNSYGRVSITFDRSFQAEANAAVRGRYAARIFRAQSRIRSALSKAT